MLDKPGFFMGAAAYFLWGILPLYFHQVAHVSSLEVLGHRILWSGVILGLFLACKRRNFAFFKLFSSWRNLVLVLLGSLFITANWLIYIYAIATEKTIDASLGYFINPIFFIVLGMLIYQEALTKAQKVCVAFAAAGILYQVVTGAAFSWISLGLPFTFALYGAIKKQVAIDSISGLFLETLFVLPITVGFFIYLNQNGSFAFASGPPKTQILLFAAGIITTVPLVLFAEGAKRLPLKVVGLLQYIGPSLQFLIGLYVFKEPFSTHKFIGFLLVWIGLSILIFGAIRGRPLDKGKRAA